LEHQSEHDTLSLTEQCFFISGAPQNLTLGSPDACQARVYVPTPAPTPLPTVHRYGHHGTTKKHASNNEPQPNAGLQWHAPSGPPTARPRDNDGSITCNRADYEENFFGLTKSPTGAPTVRSPYKKAKSNKGHAKANGKKNKAAKKANKNAKKAVKLANQANKAAKKKAKKQHTKSKKAGKKASKKHTGKWGTTGQNSKSNEDTTAAVSSMDKVYITFAGSIVLIAAMAGVYFLVKRPRSSPQQPIALAAGTLPVASEDPDPEDMWDTTANGLTERFKPGPTGV
jgi:hypothetical protein